MLPLYPMCKVIYQQFFLNWCNAKVTPDMGVFIRSMGSLNCEDMKKYMWEGYFLGTLFWGGFGAWMTFKKVEMAKTLRTGM